MNACAAGTTTNLRVYLCSKCEGGGRFSRLRRGHVQPAPRRRTGRRPSRSVCSEVTTRARQRPPAREPRRMARPARPDRSAAARRRCSGSFSAGGPKRTSRTAAAAVHLAAFDGRSCTRGGALKGWLRGGARGKRRARASASHASAREAARATPRRCRWRLRNDFFRGPFAHRLDAADRRSRHLRAYKRYFNNTVISGITPITVTTPGLG